ncbi:ferredoxin--NADP reductase [Sphingomonas desiccabilis]|uniref:ferredoxin--NADP(+) reductase n=1 Tax=Sphingomonas desiccabilis TaxID=429134 RepID=A0A4V1QPU8_9SPHN|nr:ferredoxin--NADP reductase [Sphingomonas desiccabilis]MBB3910391.1 ferredoxin--NADP+ reductase [Sphingomonas desiccabilis]RXZ35047.1 ferredoxin--NADP reductase [Sphingomonas desiccabilis]
MTDVREPVLIPESKAFLNAKVLWVRHWNDRLFSFAVERPSSFRFRSGEFVMIGLPGDTKPIMRAYSIASPHYAEELEFLSIKVEDGPLTSKLQLIQPGDEVYLGKKPTGTLVTDALTGGKRLFFFSTGTGLAPFLSLARDPDVYSMFDQVILVHSVRQVSDLAYHDELASRLADDPLVADEAQAQFHYIPTVTREAFRNTGRINDLIESAALFGEPVQGPKKLDPETDRIMLCGSMAMIRDFAAMLEGMGFVEGSNAAPGQFVIERAFVD